MAKKKKNKPYLNNADFTAEIIKCKGTDVLSPVAVRMFMLLAERANRKLDYTDSRDREDCIQSALYDLVKYWRNFNPEVSNNAFAFFTTVATNGYAKEFNKIHKGNVEMISLDHYGDSEIYTI